MHLEAADLAVVRRTVDQMWWRWRGSLPAHEREELLGRVIVALVQAPKQVEQLAPYTRACFKSALRVLREERQRAHETTLSILAIAQQLPSDAELPEVKRNWGGARPGAGRKKKAALG